MSKPVVVSLVVALVAAAGASNSAAEIEIRSALVKLIEEVDVPAREAGVLAEVLVREGQIVTEDELLAKINDKAMQLTVARAAIELKIAQKQAESQVAIQLATKSVEVSKAEMRRATESIEKFAKSISASELDRLKLMVERATLEVQHAERESEIANFTQQLKENELAWAKENLDRRKVTAPLAGMVLEVSRRRGEWVEPGETVLRIIRVDRLRAEGFLAVEQLDHVAVGQPVQLVTAAGGSKTKKFSGKIVFVSPKVDPVNSQVRVWAEIENTGLRLRPGIQGRLIISSEPAAAD